MGVREITVLSVVLSDSSATTFPSVAADSAAPQVPLHIDPSI